MRRRMMNRRSLASLACMPLLVAISSGVVQAQQPADGQDRMGKPTEAEVGPRGQRMPRHIQYSAWRKLCFKQSDNKVLCRTSSSGTWNTGQVAVRVDLIERHDGEARLQIFLPVGLYLQAGVKVKIDQGAPVQIPYSWCLSNICVAATLASPDLVQKMEAGRGLTLEVADSNILTVATTLPLDQFAAVHKGAPAQVFDYQTDQPE